MTASVATGVAAGRVDQAHTGVAFVDPAADDGVEAFRLGARAPRPRRLPVSRFLDERAFRISVQSAVQERKRRWNLDPAQHQTLACVNWLTCRTMISKPASRNLPCGLMARR